jgi:hypothetical protein
MTTIQRLGALLALSALALALTAACGSDGAAKVADPEVTTLVAAPIDDLELLIRESFPPQYALRVVSGLPNGCHQFSGHKLARDGTRITISVMNRAPTDPGTACTQVYGQHEEVIELGTNFQPGTEYTVQVNEETLTFTAQ